MSVLIKGVWPLHVCSDEGGVASVQVSSNEEGESFMCVTPNEGGVASRPTIKVKKQLHSITLNCTTSQVFYNKR